MSEYQLKEKPKDIYLEVLRGIAVIFVIFNHTDAFFLYYSSTDNPMTWLFSFVGSVLCRVNVPLFVMISGALLLEKEETIRDLFRNRIRRIGIVLVVFSLLYYVLNVVRSMGSFSPGGFLRGLLSGSIQESFWYLYLYLGILFFMPIFRAVAASCTNRELKYLMGLQIVLGIGGRIFSHLLGIEINSNIYFLNIYVFYLLSGYYWGKRIDTKQISIERMHGICLINIFCLLGVYILVRVDYFHKGVYDQGILDILTPILAPGIFLNIRWICQRCVIPEKIRKIIYEVGDCTFGIYLMEQLARILLLPMYLYLSGNTFGILACSCYVAGSFGVAWLFTELLKRIPGVKGLL